jgi:hypothetical protein
MARAGDHSPEDADRTGAQVQVYSRAAVQSVGVVIFYSGLVLLLLFVYYRGAANLLSSYVVPGLIVVLLLYLARYTSTRYRMDDRTLLARRLFGSRRMRLDRIRKVQRANLRDLGAVGFIGTWGWRGRVWSPVVGVIDTVHTGSDGLLVTGSGVPVFISPPSPDEFQAELSRRVRSANGGVALDETPCR